ncbi:MAG: 50S ribosomal protein L10 [Gammaproteobacteria bacterium]
MSLSFEQKEAVVSTVEAALASARAGVLAEYRGLTVAQLTELRAQARARGVWIKVVKNSLAKRAVAGTDFACLQDCFTGPVIFSAAEDPVAVAKVMADFAADHENLKITAGAMNGARIDRRTIGALAKLPGRDELRAQLAATMLAPVRQLAVTLAEIPTGLVRALAGVAKSAQSKSAQSNSEGSVKNTS